MGKQYCVVCGMGTESTLGISWGGKTVVLCGGHDLNDLRNMEATYSQGITPSHRTNYGLKSELVQSPSETQLTLQDTKVLKKKLVQDQAFEGQLARVVRTRLNEACYFWEPKVKPLDDHPGFEKLAETTASEITALFQQALTSLKSEMEKKKKTYSVVTEDFGTPLVLKTEEAIPISECQRVIDKELKDD